MFRSLDNRRGIGDESESVRKYLMFPVETDVIYAAHAAKQNAYRRHMKLLILKGFMCEIAYIGAIII